MESYELLLEEEVDWLPWILQIPRSSRREKVRLEHLEDHELVEIDSRKNTVEEVDRIL